MSVLSLSRGSIIDRVVPKSLTADLVLIAVGTALTAVAAQISIPASPVPFTFQTLAVLLVGTTLGAKRGALSLALYALLGIAGVPVFAPLSDGTHTTGLTAILGATFGFVIGFIAAAFVVGFLAERTWSSNAFKMFASYAIGTFVIYSFGVPVLASVATKGDLNAAIQIMIPFVAWDALKAIIAATILPIAWKLVKKVRS
ncbi:MAG: biotin transporter BioY [Rhodoluna sp.]